MLTRYTGIEGAYFKKLLKTIVEVGDLDNQRVLDFGCGTKELKRFLTHGNYVGYDIDQNRSDVATLDGIQYDVMVANEVFYEMPEADIVHLLDTTRPERLVVGIGRKGLLNKIGALLIDSDAHADYQTPPARELEILLERYRIIKRKNVWWLADVYMLHRIGDGEVMRRSR